MRRVEDLSGAWKPAPIGHNGGPPLDLSWNAWAWRRAHAKAWASPGHDIAMLRLRRAERLGLTYREYTGVLMDRGVHLGGLVLVMRDEISETAAMSKLVTRHDCRVLVCADASETFASWLRRAGMEIAREATLAAIRDFARGAELPPSAHFLVGARDADRVLAAQAGLGLFVDMKRYFTASV